MLAVLAVMVLGSCLVVPILNYSSTSLKTTETLEQNVDGLYAADAGVEDALWKLMWDPPASFPYSYDVPTDVNGMSVNVTISELTTVFGEVLDPGGAIDWLDVSITVVYDEVNQYYTFTIATANTGSGNIKIESIVIDFPAGLDYIDDSTSSNITNPIDANPSTIRGSVETGETLVWDNGVPRPELAEGETLYHRFRLAGPAGMEQQILNDAKGFIEAKRSNIGTVWLGGYPYSIVAEARNSSGELVAGIRAGAWATVGLVDVSCWQIIP